VVKYIPPSGDVESAVGEREKTLREKDLKGHIKPLKKEDARSEEFKEKDTANSSDLILDNQLKTAVDILKSWDIMKKNNHS